MTSSKTWKRVWVAVGVLLLAANVDAYGKGKPAADGDAAGEAGDPEALIRQGNELRKQGRSEQALPYFRAAYAAARTPRTAGQLGLSEMTIGYWVEAETHLGEALEFPNHPWVAKNMPTLREMIAKAREKIAEITVSGSPVGSEVRVNGRVVGSLPLPKPLRLAEGQVDIQVTSPGHKPDLRTLSAKGGEKLHVAVNLEVDAVVARTADAGSVPRAVEPQGTTTPPPGLGHDAEAPAEHAAWPTAATVTAGAGVLAIGFGVVELFLWSHAQSSFNDHLGPKPGSPGVLQKDCGEQDPMRGGPGCQSLYDAVVRDRTLAVVGVAAGAALGVTTFVLWRSSHGSSDHEQKISCAPNPVDRGMECRWRF
jgi:hypothetical protein